MKTEERESASQTLLRERSANWFEAAEERHSTRTFVPEQVGAEALDLLQHACETFRPYADARVELVRSPAADVFRGIVGSYGKVTGAPHLLVVIAGDTPVAQHHAGYTGEACVLEATARGLDTCWVGGFFSRKLVASLVDVADAEKVVAVSPVGYGVENPTATDRLMKKLARSSSRREIELIADEWGKHWPQWAQCAVECARLAPSAMNRQPWRFRYEENKLYVSKTMGETKGVSKALDCGIAMVHVQIGALEAGCEGRWTDVEELGDIASFAPISPISAG